MTVSNSNNINSCIQHWIHWCANLLCFVVAGIFVISYFRSQPESVHKFALDLPDWQRRLFVYSVCFVFVCMLFRISSPRISHVRYFFTHPPTWSAWIVGGVVLCLIDLILGLSQDKYVATWKEWMGYGLGAVGLVIMARWVSSFGETPDQSPHDRPVTIVSEASPDWTRLEPWLEVDAPATHDFLGNYAVAARLKQLLEEGPQSIGIVGPFGAGKSSIVTWIVRLIGVNSDRFIVAEHSCWGFETSSASITSMLANAISAVEEHVDTFQVSSLPESYRQTFSAGGKWLDSASTLVFGKHNPLDQFRRLSALLADINKRLVFVVEDLDRNESASFDIQEVFAFLYQLKDFQNISFVLTGGLNSPARIDFAKLCDHIEYVRTISVHQSGSLVAALRERCLNQVAFPHVYLTDPSDNEWTPNRWLLLMDRDDIWPPEAIARLLHTPRALRHALSLTYRAWQTLYGEIDFDHLLALNVLRYAAPEAFSFVLRHWNRFHDEPSNYTRQYGQLSQIRVRLQQEWSDLCTSVDWDARSARTLIDLILPATPAWLDENARGHGQIRSQGLQYDRYWHRAVNGYIGVDEIRDQEVVRDIQQWIKHKSANSALVARLCSSESFSDVWEHLAYRFFADDRERILLLCQEVLDRIRHKDKAAASSDSQGFIPLWRYANRHVPHDPENGQWLQDRISEAANTSLELVNSLWHYWGAYIHSILQPDEHESVRRHLIDVLQQNVTTSESLAQLTHPSYPYVFYQLVFDPGGHEPVLAGPGSWAWIGAILLTGLKAGQITTAIGVCALVRVRNGSSHDVPPVADTNLLRAFFGDESADAINSIEVLLPKIPENEQTFVSAIVKSARSGLLDRDES